VSKQLKLHESRCIQLGARLVEYRFVRRRRRTLGLTVDANGLAVAAPLHAPWHDIESFMRDKERWILSKLDEWARTPRPVVLHVANGETLPLFGDSLTLEVRDGGRAVKRQAGCALSKSWWDG
jgi:predicted metal-dependent hydrolase